MYNRYPRIPSRAEWLHPKNLRQHRLNVHNAMVEMSDGMIFLDNDFLDFHQNFRASNNQLTVTIVPWPGNPNFCLNLRDRDKLLKHYVTNELSILFAKYTPLGFSLISYKSWNSIPFEIFPTRDGQFGPYLLIPETWLAGFEYNPNEFDELFPVRSRLEFLRNGTFQGLVDAASFTHA